MAHGQFPGFDYPGLASLCTEQPRRNPFIIATFLILVTSEGSQSQERSATFYGWCILIMQPSKMVRLDLHDYNHPRRLLPLGGGAYKVRIASDHYKQQVESSSGSRRAHMATYMGIFGPLTRSVLVLARAIAARTGSWLRAPLHTCGVGGSCIRLLQELER